MANCNAENGILGPHPCPDQEDHGPPLQCQRGKQGPQQEQQQPVQNQYSMLFKGLFVPSRPIDSNSPHALLYFFRTMLRLTYENSVTIDIQGLNYLDT